MRPLIGLFLLLAFAAAGPAFAAPIDDANAAYQRGNYAAAEKILLPLAEAGNPYAQYRLGLVYLEATGEMRSPEEASKWLESAALQGQPHAQYKLGILYVNGNGVLRDFVQAYMWLTLSTRHVAGSGSEAVRQRDMLAARMSSSQIAEAKKLVKSWRPVKFETETPPPQR
ncbi:MAG: sel1 repeat family protein [Rhodospirillales bacterium]|nr:sel1 repeat family protein [Rhodospirillales bacterium]